MTIGRPSKGPSDRLSSLAQYNFLRSKLSVDDAGLARWLRNLPEGSMSDRDIRRFLRHEATMQNAHVRKIERYAPGLLHVTSWPWRDLAPGVRDAKLIRSALRSLDNAASVSPVSPFPEECSHPIGTGQVGFTNEDWKAADDFFRALATYHLEPTRSAPNLAILARNVVNALSRARSHSTIYEMRGDIVRCTKLILHSHLVVAFYLVAHWMNFDKKYDLDATEQREPLGRVRIPSSFNTPANSGRWDD